MSRGRPGLVGLGIGLGAAGVAGAFGVAGLVADRIRRHEDAKQPEYASLTEPPSQELTVTATDGVQLWVQIDQPTGPSTTADGRDKPTVVLSHGFCLSSDSWVLQRRALKAAGYRVISWDQRGHGRSEKGPAVGYTIDQLGQDLFRVIDATAREGDLALVGHSMGGMTTMALAESHPEIVAERTIAFGCIATSPGGLPLAQSNLAAALGKALMARVGPVVFEQLATRPEVLSALLRANNDLAQFLTERYSFASPVPRSVVRLATTMILSTDLRVMRDFVPSFDVYDKTTALVHFANAETLVFNGTQDILTPPEHSELIVRAIPGAEHVVIRDAGHIIMLEHPDLLNDQLLGMLERAMSNRAGRHDPAAKPHVTRVVTPVAKKRRIRPAHKRNPARAAEKVS